MKIKVQHNNREIGPFSLAELRQATETGEICSMDWCWDHHEFQGIRTVQQVLNDAREEAVKRKREKLGAPLPTERSQRRSAESLKEAEEWEAAAKAELEDYKHRLEHELLLEKQLLEEVRKQVKEEQALVFKDRAGFEAELAHAREDLARGRAQVAEERHQLTERNRKHVKLSAEFEARRRQVQTEHAAERKRLEAEAAHVLESERVFNQEKAEFEKERQAALAHLEREQERLAAERRRLEESQDRLQEQKTDLEARRRRLGEQTEEARARLAAERSSLASEKAALAEAERRLCAEREASEEAHRRDLARLQIERRHLEEERRRLAEMPQRQRSRGEEAAMPRDEKYYGRVLGLSGRVSYEEIKKAYRFAAFRCHPDKVQDLHPDFVSLATGKLKELNEAFNYFRERYERK